MKANGRIKGDIPNYKDIAKLKTIVKFCPKCQKNKEVGSTTNFCSVCDEELLNPTLPTYRRLH